MAPPASAPLPARASPLSIGWLALLLMGGACAPVANPGRDQWQVGFDHPVRLDGSESRRARRFEWRQVAGPPVSLQGAQTATPTFRTHPLEEVVALGEEPGTLPIPHRLRYVFELRVQGSLGRSATAQVSVTPASASPGTGGVALDTDVYISGVALDDGRGFDWELTGKPGGSRAVMLDPHSRTPHFRPDLKGGYGYTDRRSGYNNVIFAGRFDDVPKDCGRSDCHPTEEVAWKETRHAKVARHEPECIRCHTVGFDPGAQNGGFDDACPNGRCEGDKEVLGTIHCLSCHGPGFRSQANYAEGACQQCHDAPPKYTKVAEWRRAKMSHLTVGLDASAQSFTPGCPDCHSAQGFVRWMKGKPGQKLGVMTTAAPIGCPACHDPHSAAHPKQLRVYGKVSTRSGLALEGVGAGALCSTCHNAGAPRQEAIAKRRAPHAPQVDLLLAGGVQPSRWPELCVTCHVQKAHGGGGHTFIPSASAETRALQTRIGSLLDSARDALWARARAYAACGGKHRGAAVDARGEALIVVGETGHDLGDCDRNGKIEGAEKSFLIPDDRLAEDAYDYFFIERDESLGAHNPAFVQATLERLGR